VWAASLARPLRSNHNRNVKSQVLGSDVKAMMMVMVVVVVVVAGTSRIQRKWCR
jgi:hypothetical protein